MEKKVIITFSILILSLLLVSVSADNWECFNKGDTIDFCNPNVDDRTCGATSCQVCMKEYDAVNQCYNQGSLKKCNRGGSCTSSGNTTLDVTPPEFILNNPVEAELYTSRSILIDFDLNERADVYYRDNIYRPGRETRICSNCYPGLPSYSRKKSFKEGFNNITFRVVDVIGNEISHTVTFIIDSVKPKIHRTQPRSGYAGGLFEIEYTENNLKNIKMVYGNETDLREQNLTNCESGKREWCNINVDLDDYHGQKIMYYFIIEDDAGNIKESRMRKNLDVDTMFPYLNNPTTFYTQGEEGTRYNRYIYFNFNVTEENLDEIAYSYIDSRGKDRKRTICSRLRNGICEKRVSFRRGNYALDIQITDDAGNAIGEHIEFEVDY